MSIAGTRNTRAHIRSTQVTDEVSVRFQIIPDTKVNNNVARQSKTIKVKVLLLNGSKTLIVNIVLPRYWKSISNHICILFLIILNVFWLPCTVFNNLEIWKCSFQRQSIWYAGQQSSIAQFLIFPFLFLVYKFYIIYLFWTFFPKTQYLNKIFLIIVDSTLSCHELTAQTKF